MHDNNQEFLRSFTYTPGFIITQNSRLIPMNMSYKCCLILIIIILGIQHENTH